MVEGRGGCTGIAAGNPERLRVSAGGPAACPPAGILEIVSHSGAITAGRLRRPST